MRNGSALWCDAKLGKGNCRLKVGNLKRAGITTNNTHAHGIRSDRLS